MGGTLLELRRELVSGPVRHESWPRVTSSIPRGETVSCLHLAKHLRQDIPRPGGGPARLEVHLRGTAVTYIADMDRK